jgi:hypothetical protein
MFGVSRYSTFLDQNKSDSRFFGLGSKVKHHTYQLIHAKQFLAPRRQVQAVDGGLPALRVSAHLGFQGSTDNLVAETDPNDAHPPLLEYLCNVVDEFVDPGSVGKGVVFYKIRTDLVNILDISFPMPPEGFGFCPSNQHPGHESSLITSSFGE